MARHHQLAGRIGGHTRWAATPDRTAATAPGREAARTALDERLVDDFDLDRDAPDFAQRLASARSAHFSRLALASAKKRRRKTQSHA
jgi:hypothetical protein